MPVFHWNMTLPPASPAFNQRRRRRAGFACEGATAYMGLARDKSDDQLFRNARLKIPEIEMRLVRSGRNVPMAERLLALPPGNPREARHAPKPLLENGNLQLLTPPGFSVPLPGVVGLVPLSVSA